MTALDRMLAKLGACDDAREWAKSQPDLEAAWQACERADWLLWFAVEVKADESATRLAICACARTALKYVPEGENRPRVAIETAERYARGDATDDELDAARAAAWAAARNGAWAAARNGARDGARAAAWAAARNGAWDAAGAVARAAAWNAAWAAAHREMCVLVRGFFPHAPIAEHEKEAGR